VPELDNSLLLQYIFPLIFHLKTYFSELLRAVVMIIMRRMMMMMMITTILLITPTKQQPVTAMTMVITVIVIIVTIKVCKYLGIEESHQLEYKKKKGKLKKESLKRLKLVLDTKLSPNNKQQGTGMLAVTVLIYIFGNIKWHQEEGRKLFRKTRKLLSIHGQHRLEADIDH
jgi:ABC-type uncharacterized transport system permease subunit